jgi:hypothetical protein
VLEGNPAASSGDYTVRLKMPDGYRISPHWHPLRENVTVISGTFKLGMGDTFDKNKMKAFTAGSFAFLDPEMHHYAMACGEVVVQVHGMSPCSSTTSIPKTTRAGTSKRKHATVPAKQPEAATISWTD